MFFLTSYYFPNFPRWSSLPPCYHPISFPCFRYHFPAAVPYILSLPLFYVPFSCGCSIHSQSSLILCTIFLRLFHTFSVFPYSMYHFPVAVPYILSLPLFYVPFSCGCSIHSQSSLILCTIFLRLFHTFSVFPYSMYHFPAADPYILSLPLFYVPFSCSCSIHSQSSLILCTIFLWLFHTFSVFPYSMYHFLRLFHTFSAFPCSMYHFPATVPYILSLPLF